VLSFLTSEEPDPLESFETPRNPVTEIDKEQMNPPLNNPDAQTQKPENTAENQENLSDIPKTLPLRLKELKKTLNIETTDAPAEPKRPKKPQPEPKPSPKTRTHIVASGDTLSSISQKYYGNPAKWRNILDANPKLENPHSLKIGQEIKIPSLP
jgi:nucleoid-associated protein YgaU